MGLASTLIHYLVGTPKVRLGKLEKAFLTRPWEQVRDAVAVKLLDQDGELYVLARSAGRVDKERSMRRRRLKKLVKRLRELQQHVLTRDQLLLKLGAAKKEAGRAYSLVDIRLPDNGQEVTPETFQFALSRRKLRIARRREGKYLLRSNLTGDDPARLWCYYIQLTEVEQAFKELKGELAVRPIYHQTDARIEAHIFVAFMAYCLLPAGHAQAPAARAGARTDAPLRAGKNGGAANGGRAFADDRWPPPDPVALYPPGTRPVTVAGPTEAGTATPAAVQNHRQRDQSRLAQPCPCSADLGDP